MVYKLASHLAEPYTAVLVALAVALGCVWRRQHPRSRALRTAIALFVLLWVLSLPIAGSLALASLEWSYPTTTEVPATTDTIVVLSGDIILGDEMGQRAWLGSASLQRCLYGVELYRRAGRCRMLLSGGNLYPKLPCPTLAEAMREFILRQVGVHAEDLALEDRSRTTHENALFSKPLLADDAADRHGRVFLVTAAVHMRRAVASFRSQGIEVVPAPCDQQVPFWKVTLYSFIPSSRGLSMVAQAAHEWLGLFWYWLQGRL